MKKSTLSTALLVICAGFAMVGCDEGDGPSLAVNPTSIQAPWKGALESVAITASGNWTATTSETWVELSKSAGDGSDSIFVTIYANLTSQARVATITLQADDVSAPQIIDVTQPVGTPLILFNSSRVTFGAPDSTVATLRILANTPWTLSDNQDWLTATPTSGDGDGTVTLNAEAITGLARRVATLSFVSLGAIITKEISVVQNPRVMIVAGGNGIGPNLNQLHTPTSVWGDNNGNIFVSELFNHRVVKWTANGLAGTVVAGGNGEGNGLNQFHSPYSVFVRPNGEMFIGDNNNHRVVKWEPGATSGTVVAGGNGIGHNLDQVSSPDGVYVTANGDLYVSEAGNNRVTKWVRGSSTGTVVAEGEMVGFTTAVTLDGDGNVYIGSSQQSTVTKWSPGATEGIIVAGGNGRGANLNQLTSPSGLFVDSDKNLFVVDQGNHRVMKWIPGATTGILVAGGNGGTDSSIDQLREPTGIWVDDEGNIYVTQQGNGRVVKWLK